MQKKTKVLLVGWDAADWQIINPLLNQGKMPGLARIMHEGAWGNLATLDPPISPMLWTSVSTGKRPYKHGIHGFTELAPDGETVRPVRVTSRKCKAVWNILNENGYKTNVIGWWPSHPAEKLNGVCVSNFYGISPDEKKEDWPLIEGAVHPKELADELAELRLNPKELTPAIMKNFFPNAYALNSDDDAILRSAMRILAHASSVHNAATHILETTEWDFTAVYFDALDHFSHLGMKYHPPKMQGITDDDFIKYNYIVEAAYRFHDMMLDRLLDLAGEDCQVILVSDHGFENSQKRMLHLPDEPGAPALEHRPYGVFAASGTRVKKGQVYGASLLDVTPTILQLFGLPLAEDMDGNVIQDAVIQGITSFVKTYESNEKTEKVASDSSSIDKDLLKQLEALGYIKTAKTPQEKKVLLSENEYYLARSLADGGKFEEAAEKMNFLQQAFPEVKRYAQYNASLLLRLGRFDELKTWLEAQEDSPFNTYLSGLIYLQEAKPLLAANTFQKIDSKANDALLCNIAIAWQQAGDVEMASEFATKALSLNAENQNAINLLGNISFQKENWEDALVWYFKSLGLLYYQPNIHEKIGQCFYWLQMFTEAAQSFEVSLRLNPSKLSVIEQLTSLYADELPNEKRLHQLTKSKGAFATIVSGFPRSGTSMIMKMLQLGGMSLLSDELRQADENNLRGYFELEEVKKTAFDQSYLRDAAGKAVKIVMPLTRLLHPVLPLKVIWMDRDLASILKSQEKMKGDVSTAAPFQLIAKFKKEQELMHTWLNQHPHVSYIKLSYDDVLNEPLKSAEKLSDFLGKILDIQAMAASVSPQLKHF